jgi:hypothetical protein
MTVSIPEKTLEHWASMYINYRYRSFAHLWWPTFGEDIAVGSIPMLGGGKAFHLELKTATPSSLGSPRHKVKIRLQQLEGYVKGSVPVYYVVPEPRWRGSLNSRIAPGLPAAAVPTDFGFQRSRPTYWFGDWVYVIPAHVLYRLLSPKIAALRSAGTLTKETEELIFTYDHTTGLAVYETISVAGVPLGSLADTDFWKWQEFWDLMERCGGPEMPAVLLTGADLGDTTSWDRLRETLRYEDQDFPRADYRYSPNDLDGVIGKPLGTYRKSSVENLPRRPLSDDPFLISVLLARGALKLE